MPWWQRELAEQRQPIAAVGSLLQQYQSQQPLPQQLDASPDAGKPASITTIAKALLVTRRRLRLDPDRKLYFLYEPGKQVSSAVRIKNTSRSAVAFKFQTNAPKSCFMRPPSGILSPGEAIVATVVKFVEQPEPNQDTKCRDKFKIVSLKVKQGMEFTHELFDEHKEFVAVERVLRVVFLDPQGNSPEVEKLYKRLAEAEAAQQARKKPADERNQKTAAAVVVPDEWKEQQPEEQLSTQQTEGAERIES